MAEAHAEVVKQQKQEVSAATENLTSPNNLLFCDHAEVDKKSTIVSWKFQGKENALRVRRDGGRLYIESALGKPAEALAAMREDCDGEPFVQLKHILAKDGEHLCLEEETDGRTHYKFGDFVPRNALAMTCWVRTGFGACLRDRLLPEDAHAADIIKPATPVAPKQRPVKGPGETLTDPEFVFQGGGLGGYDLVYEVGFKYEPRDEENKPTGVKFEITERATARVERKLVEDDKTKIALLSISTPELAKLLEAGGAVEGAEYFEGAKGSSLPTPLRLGISQTFGRLKKSETKVS